MVVIKRRRPKQMRGYLRVQAVKLNERQLLKSLECKFQDFLLVYCWNIGIPDQRQCLLSCLAALRVKLTICSGEWFRGHARCPLEQWIPLQKRIANSISYLRRLHWRSLMVAFHIPLLVTFKWGSVLMGEEVLLFALWNEVMTKIGALEGNFGHTSDLLLSDYFLCPSPSLEDFFIVLI